MLRCISAAVIALILWPSIAKCDNLVLEMTTTASLGPNASIFPSSASIPLDLLSASDPTPVSLPNVFYMIISGNNQVSGTVELNLNLIAGSETVSKTAQCQYLIYSGVTSPGALGAHPNWWPLIFR